MSNDQSVRPDSMRDIFLGGAVAGAVVDLVFYPLDTLKTRLQSPQGFFAAGGFQRLYRGIQATAFGSVPSSALFFGTYEFSKKQLARLDTSPVFNHMIAAALGEAVACLIRVPVDNVKQKMQVTHESFFKTMLQVRHLGIRGYFTTLMRDIPFAIIQFPLYEWMKKEKIKHQNSSELSLPAISAIGAISGGFAAAVTTPVDVIKTRLILINDKNGVPYNGPLDVVKRISRQEGLKVFFSGISPRVIWIAFGGIFYFGTFEGMLKLTRNFSPDHQHKSTE